jgi:hypothetical protein
MKIYDWLKKNISYAFFLMCMNVCMECMHYCCFLAADVQEMYECCRSSWCIGNAFISAV